MAGNRSERSSFLFSTGVGALVGGIVLALAALTMTPVGADHVDPVDVVGDDNPSCTDVNAAYVFEFKLEGTPANTPEGDPIEISEAESGVVGGGTMTISNAGVVDGVFEFDWSSSIAWDAVLVKQGDGATVYTYVPEATGDTDVHPSLTNGQPTGGISHVTFCRDSVTTTTTESTTTTTEGTTTSATVLGTVVTQAAAPSTSPTVLGAQVTRALPTTGASTSVLVLAAAGLVGLGLALVRTARLRDHRA